MDFQLLVQEQALSRWEDLPSSKGIDQSLIIQASQMLLKKELIEFLLLLLTKSCLFELFVSSQVPHKFVVPHFCVQDRAELLRVMGNFVITY